MTVFEVFLHLEQEAPFQSWVFFTLHEKVAAGKAFTAYKPDKCMFLLIYFCSIMRFSFEPRFALPFTGASVVAYTL